MADPKTDNKPTPSKSAPPEPEAPDPRDEALAAMEKRLAEMEALLERYAPRPTPETTPAKRPAYDKKPPAAGMARIRIKEVMGRPTVPKVKLVDDDSIEVKEKTPDLYHCHGYLHAGEVVDVPAKMLTGLKSRRGESLRRLDILEEVSDLPATRPLYYPSEHVCMAADPRRASSNPEDAKRDIEALNAAMRKGVQKVA